MPTALFLSPHLDDVAFSCGGLAALLHDRGWVTIMVTVFTRSIHPATGFALACQLDKGLGPEVDYMALRRAEDAEAARILGLEARSLDFPEAPHRGYESAPALFGPVLESDRMVQDLIPAFSVLRDALQPALVLAPQGLGDHVDHQIVIQVVQAVFSPLTLAFYRDTPYAIRNPSALVRVVTAGILPVDVEIGAAMDRKVAASSAYGSQVGFQFGGVAPLGDALRAFAEREGGGRAAERFLAAPGVPFGGLERATL